MAGPDFLLAIFYRDGSFQHDFFMIVAESLERIVFN